MDCSVSHACRLTFVGSGTPCFSQERTSFLLHSKKRSRPASIQPSVNAGFERNTCSTPSSNKKCVAMHCLTILVTHDESGNSEYWTNNLLTSFKVWLFKYLVSHGVINGTSSLWILPKRAAAENSSSYVCEECRKILEMFFIRCIVTESRFWLPCDNKQRSCNSSP